MKDCVFENSEVCMNFTLRKKSSIIAVWIYLIFLMVAFTVFTLMIIPTKETVALVFFISFDLITLGTILYMILAKPMRRLIHINSQGVSDIKNGIYLAWDDIKNIGIQYVRAGRTSLIFVVITTDENREFPKEVKARLKYSNKLLIVEYRAKVIETIYNYWQKEIVNQKYITACEEGDRS